MPPAWVTQSDLELNKEFRVKERTKSRIEGRLVVDDEFVIPGIENFEPLRTDTRRGSFGSPSFLPWSASSLASAASVCWSTSAGTFPPEAVERLQHIGRWMKSYNQSIYGATYTPMQGQAWGRATRKGDKLYQSLHLVESYRTRDGKVRQRILINFGSAHRYAKEEVREIIGALSKFFGLEEAEPEVSSSIAVSILEVPTRSSASGRNLVGARSSRAHSGSPP
jgi:hypothetical protein